MSNFQKNWADKTRAPAGLADGINGAVSPVADMMAAPGTITFRDRK